MDGGRVPAGSGEESGSWLSRPRQQSRSGVAVLEEKLHWVPVDPGQAQLVAGAPCRRAWVLGRAWCVTHAIPCFVLSKP